MPAFRAIAKPKPIEIDKFLGLNESVGETEIKLGQTVNQTNFRLTQDYKLEKREGHSTFIDFGSGDVQGMWHGEISKDFTITNEFTNSDFSSGTTGWTGYLATLSAADNVLSVTSDGTSPSAFVIQDTVNAVQPNNKFYIYANVRVTSADCQQILIYVDGSTAGTDTIVYTLDNPVINQWYDIYIITEPPSDATGNLRVFFAHKYADAATANGKVMEMRKTILSDMTDGEHEAVNSSTMLAYSDPHFTTTATGTVDKNILIACNGGTAYEYNLDDSNIDTAIADLLADETVLELGSITDAKTSIFWFESAIYFINGTDYKVYDGTTYADVVGYIPTIAIETPPAGGGTDYEQVNLITGWKAQDFVGDNVSTTYQLRELAIDADEVIVIADGVTLTEDTDFTVNRTNGTIDFSAGTGPYGAPATDEEVTIKWAKVTAGNKALVTGNKYAMDFGPSNDTAVFLWGHETYKNKVLWCGVLDATYFPEFYFNLIGSDEFAVTDITAQYDKQIISKQGRTFYSYADYNSTTGVYDYPVFDLNEAVGNEAFGGVQLIDNTPVSLYKNYLWKWKSSSVESEINVSRLSERIWKSLSEVDLSTAITFDYQSKKELWVNVGDTVYIYNYGNDTFYTYDNVSGTCFLDIDGTVYYGGDSTVEKFGGYADNGVAVSANAELGFTDFGVNELKKSTRLMFVSIYPYSHTSLQMSFVTDKFNTEKDIKEIDFGWLDYDDVDYADWYYTTNANPQIFRRKLRARKYAYIKFKFKHEEDDEPCLVLGFKVVAEANGYVR